MEINSIFSHPFMILWKAVRVCWDISGSNVGYYRVYFLLDCNDVLFAVKMPTPSKSLPTCIPKKEATDSCENLVNFRHLRRKHIPASLYFTQTCAISYFNLFRSSDDKLSHWPSSLKLVTPLPYFPLALRHVFGSPTPPPLLQGFGDDWVLTRWDLSPKPNS
jgi:hypothetical protein